ncbi:plasmid mobilization relaxosome protein MobC [Paenarthrobacter sp. Z7-10]|uniref:plasmid mobilization relaxosome protein MobC n=1 Tax=Paenarthrobacter sp. Z7-10 TaxID=2787635 RepID=UPI0022A929AB|nr:plasmid mobilization relaxosome protein MobC [Paenarthrobacter sp. Z7-10]MCZ2404915.1 plasmid mobilization relaxosome protein MobC [Paenarthrobacter sp. Z7-10]
MSGSSGFAGWKSRRRRANIDGGRLHRHEVKVSPAEEAKLLALAEKHRVTVPRLLIEAALSEGTESPSERRDQFMQLSNLQRLVGTVANNINQIARHANATGEVPAEAAASIAHARAVIVRIDRHLAEMAGR